MFDLPPGSMTLEPFALIVLAGVLTLPTAYNREQHSRIMGLRTFPLVSIGACAFVLLGEAYIGPNNPDAIARLLQGLMSGIGFVGGGAILKHDDHVSGTASAASIWVTGAVGACVGLGYWHYALCLSALNFLIVLVFPTVKSEIGREEIDD